MIAAARRFGAALVVALVLVAVLPVATTAHAADPPTPVRVTVAAQATWVARNTDFTMTLDVAGAPVGAKASTTVYQALSNRKAFDASLTDPTLDGPFDANLPDVAIDAQPASPDGGRSVTISIRIRDGGTATPGSVDISQFGVYPVEVVVRSADGRQLARLVTHFVRLPDPGEDTKPVVASLILPVDASPALQLLGGYRLADADRSNLEAIGGALALNPDKPVTLAPTAETLDGLAGTGEAKDAATLAQLKAAAQGAQVLAEPYVRLDPSSWLAAGLDPELSGQQLLGASTVAERLGKAPSSSVAVTGKDVSPDALARLNSGRSRALVPEAALTPVGDDPTTRPFLLSSGSTTVTAFAIDGRLQTAFTRHADDPVLSAHEILAELAMVFNDDTTDVQGVALVPPAGFTATYGFLDALLDGLSSGAPVVTPTTADGLFGYVPIAGPDGRPAGSDEPLTRSLAGRAAPSLGGYPNRLRAAASALGTLRSMVGAADPEVTALSRQLLVSGSTQLSSAERRQRTDRVNGVADKELGQVALPDNQTVTLASNSADIPLTIRNGLDRTVTVRLRLQSTTKRLELPDGPVITQVLAPSTSTRVSIRIRSQGSGVSPLDISLQAPDGRQLGATRYKVQSTAVSGVGLIITIGAAAFLVLWWARHWRRDRREKRPRHAPRRSGAGSADPEPADA